MSDPNSAQPYIPSETGVAKSDLPNKVTQLERAAASLAGAAASPVLQTLEQHMRAINSYYSNMIEGHTTHPRDIRSALAGELSDDPHKRNLQLESLAHIRVQDKLATMAATYTDACSPSFICDIHRCFYQEMPKEFRKVSVGGKDYEIKPGQYRDHPVAVGLHEPPPVESLPAFMDFFGETYGNKYLTGERRVIAIMAAHHRLAWIHPFLDGNGRTARLHTDALLKAAGVRGTGVWCLSRGLARKSTQYKAALADADSARRGTHDGRGALSEQALIKFCDFMLDVALDQVDYIAQLLDLKGMRKRIKAYVQARQDGRVIGMQPLDPYALSILEKAYIYGEVERRELFEASPYKERKTRQIISELKSDGLITETSSRSPLRWAIPSHAESHYFPELTPTA
ncbi:Fic family protein [Litorivivens lipolytica]|uniref:Fic family protein n=1 Tax=Litorivivens lipolytica TaxID=1524264 RepID=A0A7W4W7F8_9GAMM|nr:Fic family protein [Litorivivens lipolytica]MBB3048893.1 Fic family protein [Litorivivens lipolytica]